MPERYEKARRIAYTSDRVFRDGGMNCFNGVGGKKGGLCVVVESVDGEDAKMGGIGHGRKWWPLFSILDDFGVNRRDVHVTAMVKSASKSSGKVTATELADWHSFFVEELLHLQPSAILASGTTVAQEILGKDYSTTVSRGYPFGFSIESWSPDESAACKVVPCHSLAEIKHHPELDPLLRNDVRTAMDVVEGVPSRHPRTTTRVLHTPAEVRQVADALLAGGSVTLGLDCEWHGKNWMDPDRYFRTIQFAWSPTESAIVELSTEGGEPCDDVPEVLSEVGRLLTDGNTAVFGQNIIADGEWLLSYGIDIRPRVMYDTMLAEYILRSDLPLSLDELAMRRTQYGRYSAPVEVWVRAHPKETALGYGFVPREMLLSYASDDVTVLWDIMKSQLPELQARGYLDRRGRYPSLFATTMHTQQSIYELELNGMPVDKERLRQLVDVYQAKYAELLGIITSEAMSLGMPSFNPNSTADKRKLLYNYCGITPVRTSTGRDWGDYVGNMSMDSTDEVNPSTDKSTLAILAQNNPIARHLIHYNAVGQVCKTWLKYPDGSGEGGLFADLWADGKLHSHMSQLTQTGRLRTQSPNVQNFPKRAEGVLLEVFGKDGMPPMIRSIVKPPDGWVMIEGDFSQAELFTLANLSGDEGMLKSLNTPGLDLHDKSAVDGFGFRMESKDGRPVTLDDLVRLASEPDGEDSPEYQDTLKGLTYIAQNGKRYSRAEFKNGPRIAAKAISFSVPYGIAAPSLAYNIKAQTGDTRDLAEMTAEIGRLIEKWKTVTFPTAWDALEGWQQSVYDPGYLDNPWGRRKWFHVRRGEHDPAQEREAGNYPMQSLVADTVQIACHRLLNRRKEMGLHFKLQNQIHDALMLEVPESELDRTKEVLHWAMSEIDIPTYVPGKTFRLGCDIDEYERWGEKRK